MPWKSLWRIWETNWNKDKLIRVKTTFAVRISKQIELIFEITIQISALELSNSFCSTDNINARKFLCYQHFFPHFSSVSFFSRCRKFNLYYSLQKNCKMKKLVEIIYKFFFIFIKFYSKKLFAYYSIWNDWIIRKNQFEWNKLRENWRHAMATSKEGSVFILLDATWH